MAFFGLLSAGMSASVGVAAHPTPSVMRRLLQESLLDSEWIPRDVVRIVVGYVCGSAFWIQVMLLEGHWEVHCSDAFWPDIRSCNVGKWSLPTQCSDTDADVRIHRYGRFIYAVACRENLDGDRGVDFLGLLRFNIETADLDEIPMPTPFTSEHPMTMWRWHKIVPAIVGDHLWVHGSGNKYHHYAAMIFDLTAHSRAAESEAGKAANAQDPWTAVEWSQVPFEIRTIVPGRFHVDGHAVQAVAVFITDEVYNVRYDRSNTGLSSSYGVFAVLPKRVNTPNEGDGTECQVPEVLRGYEFVRLPSVPNVCTRSSVLVARSRWRDYDQLSWFPLCVRYDVATIVGQRLFLVGRPRWRDYDQLSGFPLCVRYLDLDGKGHRTWKTVLPSPLTHSTARDDDERILMEIGSIDRPPCQIVRYDDVLLVFDTRRLMAIVRHPVANATADAVPPTLCRPPLEGTRIYVPSSVLNPEPYRRNNTIFTTL